MSHGLMPSCASSTIRSLMALGRGLPLTNTPPSWFTSPKAGSASKRKHTRRTRRMAQKGASELLLIARQMSQLGDPQVTPRTLLYNSGMPPKLKGGRGRERQIGKGKKKNQKNKNEGGKKKKVPRSSVSDGRDIFRDFFTYIIGEIMPSNIQTSSSVSMGSSSSSDLSSGDPPPVLLGFLSSLSAKLVLYFDFISLYF